MLNIFQHFVVLWIVLYLRNVIKASPVFSPHNVFTKTIRMPNAISDKADSLLCHAAKLDPDEHYILRYEPHATKKVAHHMMVYGCGLPGSDKPYWSCASMDDHSNKSVCADGERQIIWAWAMDADGRKFPEGVGFRIGGNTKIHYIVIQLHYAKKFAPGKTDRSGVTLYMTHKPQPLQAGYYVLYTYGYVPPMVEEYHIESACTYNNNYTIYPIAYRTHSHNLGVVTSGYRIRNGTWTEIGRMSPQLPQTFYDVTTPGVEIKKNDILAARCTMSSQRNDFTIIGSRNEDEMCNFYILYYTKAQHNLNIQYCMRDGANFHWSDYLPEPPKTASSITGLPKFTRTDPYSVKTMSERDEMTLM